ncbi:hypothetical protein FS749_008111 [Ceratobasidium sp. UAMH 11750]|nr:hypothetical protein FS749_008111 [Ceratobasidium sp. UAMH 11750]
MLFAIPVIIAAIAAYVPLMTLFSDPNATIWCASRPHLFRFTSNPSYEGTNQDHVYRYSPWTLSEFKRAAFIYQIQAYTHELAASWQVYFAHDLRLYLGLPPLRTPLILFEEIDLAWGSCRKDDHFSICIGPGHSFVREIIVPIPPETFIATLMRALESWLMGLTLADVIIIVGCLATVLMLVIWRARQPNKLPTEAFKVPADSIAVDQESRGNSQDPPSADPCSAPPPATGVDQESQESSEDPFSPELSSPVPQSTAVDQESQEADSQDHPSAEPRSLPTPAAAVDQESQDPSSADPSPPSPAAERPPAPSQTAGRSLPSEDFYRRFYGVNGFRPNPNRTLSPLERGILPPGTVTFPTVGSPFAGTPNDPALWRRPPIPGSIGFDPAHRGPRPTTSQQPSAGESSASGSVLLNSLD